MTRLLSSEGGDATSEKSGPLQTTVLMLPRQMGSRRAPDKEAEEQDTGRDLPVSRALIWASR